MLLQLALTTLLALGAAPCVLQRACPARAPRPPSAVCMHRLQPNSNDPKTVNVNSSTHYNRDNSSASRPSQHAQTHKGRTSPHRARVLLQALLWLPLVTLLLFLPVFLLQGGRMIAVLLFVMSFGIHQIAAECKNCVVLGKEEKAMFRAHSDACLTQSEVDPKLVDSLLHGELVEDPRLKKHVYCVLLKCKMIGKDGKLQKAAVLGKMATRGENKNITKVLENCANQQGESPEDLAWNLFRCGYDKKAVLFDYMPAGSGGSDDNDTK